MDLEPYIRRYRIPGVDAEVCGPWDPTVHGSFSLLLSLWFGVLGLLQGHRYPGWIASTHPRECEDSKAGDQGGFSLLGTGSHQLSQITTRYLLVSNKYVIHRNIVYEVLLSANYAEENKVLVSKGFMSVWDDKPMDYFLMNKEG